MSCAGTRTAHGLNTKAKDERQSLENNFGVRHVVTGNWIDYIAANLPSLYSAGSIFK
jgi:hypothetical protein